MCASKLGCTVNLEGTGDVPTSAYVDVLKSTKAAKSSGTAIYKNNIEMPSTSGKGATSKNTSRKKNKAVHAQNTDAA